MKIRKEKKKAAQRIIATAALSSMCILAVPTSTAAESATIGTSTCAEIAYELSGYESYAAENIRASRINYNLPGIPSRYLSSYAKKTATYNGRSISGGAIVVNGITYVSIKAFSERITGGTVTYNASTRTTVVSANGLYLTATDGGFVIFANDRPLFSFSPNIVMSNGEMYVPSSALEKAYGIKRSSENDSAVAYSGTYTPLLSAARFYREDEVYWLSKIISAESAGESLLGQIAVGDVILNRVKSKSFPNTIYSVIFDKKYGVQFSPTADGRIYASPTYTATLAAKICLEGISLSDDAIYFLNPRVAESNWIVKNCTYLYTIGNHDFYK